MTNPVTLYGTQSNGETLPVQVDEFGRLVAEGLQGIEGPPGPEGPPGDDGGAFPLPPDPYEGALLGWSNDELAWVDGGGTPPGDEVLVATTFMDGSTSFTGPGSGGYSTYKYVDEPDNFRGFLCASFRLTSPSVYSGIFVRVKDGTYRTQDAKDQSATDSMGTMNRDPDFRTLSAYNNWATINGVNPGKTAIAVSMERNLADGMYMWVVDCARRQLFIGETMGQGRWINNKQPGMETGIASVGNGPIQICASPYQNATWSILDTDPPPIAFSTYTPRYRHYSAYESEQDKRRKALAQKKSS